MPKHYWSLDARMPLMQGTALAWRTAHPEQPIHPTLQTLPLYLRRPVGCPVFRHLIQCHTQAECKTSVHSSQSAQYCERRHLDRADLRVGTTIPFDLFSEGQLWSYKNKWIRGAGQLDAARDGAGSWRPKVRTASVSVPFLLCPCLSKYGPHISSTVYPRKLARNSNSQTSSWIYWSRISTTNTDTPQMWEPPHKDYGLINSWGHDSLSKGVVMQTWGTKFDPQDLYKC